MNKYNLLKMRIWTLLFFFAASAVSALWTANCTQSCTVNFLSPVVPDCAPVNCSISCVNGPVADYCHDMDETLESCEIVCDVSNCTASTPDCSNRCPHELECDGDGLCSVLCVEPVCEYIVAPGSPVAVPVCEDPVCEDPVCEETTAAAPRGFSLF